MSKLIKIYSRIADVSDPFKGILLDAYGVFWGGNAVGLLPGAKEMMERLVKEGKIVGILSNTTQLSSKETVKLEAHGLLQGRHFHFFTSSGETAKRLFSEEKLPFETPRKKFWLFGGAHPKFSSHWEVIDNTLYTETTDPSEADFIYISIPHIQGEDQTDPKAFEEAIARLIDYRLPMICTNPDRFAHEGSPPQAVVRQGSIARIYEELGGRVFYVGKPFDTVYNTAMQHFSEYGKLLPAEILMVGDTPETDIRGACNYGMASALVTKTGTMADRIAERGWEKIIQEFLPGDFPDFFIERL